MDRGARAMMLRRTEWWLFRQGLPKFIPKQGFRSHTLARMFPFLLFVAVLSAAGVFDVDWRVTLVVSTLPSIAVWLYVTRAGRAGRRPPPPVPTWLAATLVSAYFLTIPLAAVVFALAWPEEFKAELETSNVSSELVWIVIGWIVLSAFALGVANFATRYGLVAIFMHALRDLADDLRSSFGLLGHALPAVLFLTLFLFFTDNIWQLTKNLDRWRLGYLFALFAAVIALAIRARLREELHKLERAMSAPELERACHGTPLEPAAAELAPSTQPTPRRRAEERNILLVLFSRQVIRATVVGVGVFLFFQLFGLITVTDPQAKVWIDIEASQELPELPLGISKPMFKVSALLAGFSAMYFAVSSMTDSESRQRYFDPVLEEISRVLAVRAVYLKLRETPPDPAPGEADAGRPSGAGTAAAS